MTDAPFFYQGSDWVSYRQSVARAFDSLDRLRDACLSRGWVDETKQAGSLGLSLRSILTNLGTVLYGQLAAVATDTIAPDSLTGDFKQSWGAFELRRRLIELTAHLAKLTDSNAKDACDALAITVSGLRESLKRLDQ